MPYLSHNYRYQPRPRARNLVEAGLFVAVSALAILFTLFILGWFSASAAETAVNIDPARQVKAGMADNFLVPTGEGSVLAGNIKSPVKTLTKTTNALSK